MNRLMTKPTKWHVRPVKTQISLGIRPVWSESSLTAWRNPGSLATHWAHSEDSDKTGRMSRLIWVFAGCTVILLVLSWGGSNGEKMLLLRDAERFWYFLTMKSNSSWFWTHIWPVDFFIPINWTSPFPKGVSGVFFYFHFILNNRIFCKQAV